jgi:hypothetical protein
MIDDGSAWHAAAASRAHVPGMRTEACYGTTAVATKALNEHSLARHALSLRGALAPPVR